MKKEKSSPTRIELVTPTNAPIRWVSKLDESGENRADKRTAHGIDQEGGSSALGVGPKNRNSGALAKPLHRPLSVQHRMVRSFVSTAGKRCLPAATASQLRLSRAVPRASSAEHVRERQKHVRHRKTVRHGREACHDRVRPFQRLASCKRAPQIGDATHPRFKPTIT